MKCRFGDENMYDFHENDRHGICFLCRMQCEKTFTVRDLRTGKMVHLCDKCMLANLTDYMLDNTRPWVDPS